MGDHEHEIIDQGWSLLWVHEPWLTIMRSWTMALHHDIVDMDHW